MAMTNEEHRELIRSMNAQADQLARHAENAGDTRAFIESYSAIAESIILFGKIIEPIADKVAKALDEEQRERDEAEPNVIKVDCCNNCPFPISVAVAHSMYSTRLLCGYPDADDENGQWLGETGENNPTVMPEFCPLLKKGALHIIPDTTTTDKESTQ